MQDDSGAYIVAGPNLRGRGTGQLPRASTTRGPPQKTVKKILT